MDDQQKRLRAAVHAAGSELPADASDEDFLTEAIIILLEAIDASKSKQATTKCWPPKYQWGRNEDLGREVVITWPPTITSAEYEDMAGWIENIQRELKRCVQGAGE